ncbi:MAG: FG-GAP-like repeat-containing protein, partial [Chthoniobacterales bacterium]
MIRSLSGPRRLRNFVVLWLVLLSIASKADAYNATGKSWPANSTLTLQFSLGAPVLPLLDSNTSWNAAAAPAIDAWNAKMARLQITKVMDSTAPVASGDRVNSVAFSNSVFGQSFGSGTLAVTYYFTQGSTFLEADVLFNRAQTFDSYRGPLRFGGPGGYATGDIRRVLLHELGHALGLDHAPGDNVMSPITSDREVLSDDDVAGIQSIYGAPAPAPNPIPTPAPVPTLAAQSDFNGDAKVDLIWQNNVTGERGLWLMNGTTQTGVIFLPTIPLAWRIAATADFNGDGMADILWENTVTGERGVWLMNGAVIMEVRFLPTISTDWEIAGTGDFNHDGHPDLVWQNKVTGERGFWLMNGLVTTEVRMLPSAPTDWEIVGTDDFNGDGQPDLLWQNKVTGQRAFWFLNGTAYTGAFFLPTIATVWNIAGTNDMNGDGQIDIIWQNTATGERAVWFMNGTNHVSDKYLPT